MAFGNVWNLLFASVVHTLPGDTYVNEAEETGADETDDTEETVANEVDANEVDEVDANEMEETGANEVEKTSTNEMEETSTNEVDEVDANEMEETGANEVEETSTNEVDEVDANEMEETGANEVEETSTNEVEETGANEVEETGTEDADETGADGESGSGDEDTVGDSNIMTRLKRRRSTNYNADIHGSSSKDVFVPYTKKSRGKPQNVKALVTVDVGKKGNIKKTKCNNAAKVGRTHGVNPTSTVQKTVATKKPIRKNVSPSKKAVNYNNIASCLSKMTRDIDTIKNFTKDINIIRKVVCDILDMQQFIQDNMTKSSEEGGK